MRTYQQIIEAALSTLQDSGYATWTDAELDSIFRSCLTEVSSVRPYQSKETLTTTASKKLTLTAENKRKFLAFSGPERAPAVEYPVDEDPISLHNFSRFGDELIIDRKSVV